MMDEATLRAIKSEIGRSLMQKYGAHGVGVRAREDGGERGAELALTLYVEELPEDAPDYVEHVPQDSDEIVRVPLQMVVRGRAGRQD